MALSFVVGIIGGVIGAYVGMKVGIAKLETWREVFAAALHEMQGDVAVLKEDATVHDSELGIVMGQMNLQRARRQRFRG